MTAAVAHRWARLDHEGLGMSAPAVYVRLPTCTGSARPRPVCPRAADRGRRPIPRSAHVVADVADPRTLTVVVSARPCTPRAGRR
jgi:hypothetical protein